MSEQIKPKTLPGFMELLPNEQILFNKGATTDWGSQCDSGEFV